MRILIISFIAVVLFIIVQNGLAFLFVDIIEIHIQNDFLLVLRSSELSSIIIVLLISIFLYRKNNKYFEFIREENTLGDLLIIIILIVLVHFVVESFSNFLWANELNKAKILPKEDVSFNIKSIIFLNVVLLSPFLEELLFRGIILPNVFHRYGRLKSVLFTSILYMLAHVDIIGEGDNAEIKLINNKTGEILDISSGDKKASHAAISPKEDMIAYVKTDRSGSELYLIAMPNYLIKVFDKNNLNNQARSLFDHDVCKICNWSKLYWSPDGGKIAFFVCSQKNTALFFVTAKANEVPKVIQNTVNGFNHPRDAAWLNDSTLIFTSTETKDNYLYKIEPAKQDHPERIYGAIR